MCRRWRELCQLSLRSVRQINLNRYFGPLQCRPALTDQRFKLVLQLLPNLQRLELGPAGARLSRNGILSIGKADTDPGAPATHGRDCVTQSVSVAGGLTQHTSSDRRPIFRRRPPLTPGPRSASRVAGARHQHRSGY